jgi:hypothetical protein
VEVAISSQDLAPHTPKEGEFAFFFYAMSSLQAMAQGQQGRCIRLKTVHWRWLGLFNAFAHNKHLETSRGSLQGFA